LREVAAQAGFKNTRADVAKSSLCFVQQAVHSKGCVGVKLYPPLGFAAYGNSALDPSSDPAKGGIADFWQDDRLPDWTSHPIPYPDGTIEWLGHRLDDALDELYKWCVAEQVPILAHTNETNGTNCKYEQLARADYWTHALSKYPGLRVNFGHLGGLDNWVMGTDFSATLPETSQAFVAMFGVAGFPNVYGDVAYSGNMLLQDASGFYRRIQTAYAQAGAGKNQLPSHLLYGTDWSLLATLGDNEEYMKRFVQLFDSIGGAACARHSAKDCFFGWNAAEYLGLHPGMPGRNAWSRLEAFYAEHCIPKPIWMQKIEHG
jgi:predicted TIM-barrel fold metal-dependent hydrolase